MVPYGASPVNPTGPNQPGWIETDDPNARMVQNEKGHKHGSNLNVNISSSEFNEIPLEVLAGNIGFQQSTSENPLLPPMKFIRMALAERAPIGMIQEKIYEELLKKLPSSFQKKLEEEKRKEKGGKSVHWQSFDENLRCMARFLASLSGVSEKEEEEKEEDDFFMKEFSSELKKQGTTFMDASEKYLEKMSANAPERDLLKQMMNELSELM